MAQKASDQLHQVAIRAGPRMTVRRHWHFVSRMTSAEWRLHIRVTQAVGRIEFLLGKPPRGRQIHIDLDDAMISDWPGDLMERTRTATTTAPAPPSRR